uniref:hypothetical protein n=1 Tax=Prevotella sp. TaxID=59823 RepID=UPI004029A20E
MKKEYIKPIIINIKTCNDDALLQSASLYDYDKVDPDENIAGEGGEPDTGDDGFIWND